MKLKLGLIGCGNMGSAILNGAFKSGVCASSHVWVTDKIQAKAREFSQLNKCRLASDAAQVVQKADVILLAVKPQDLAETASSIRPFLNSQKIIISILAGVKLEKLKKQLAPAIVVRTMPNLGAQVGAAVTAICSSNAKARNITSKIFSACGRAVILNEKYFDAVTAVSGSGPAYFFLIMELLESFALAKGIPAAAARELAVQTARGAGMLASESDDAPAVLRQKVTSKKGTTDAALSVLKYRGFHKMFFAALQAAVKRSSQLSR